MKKYFGLGIASLFPLLASAAMFAGIKGAIGTIIEIVSQLRGLAVGLALLYFFWGIAKYIRASGDEKELAAGKRIMIWGVVALFVMTSVGGLVTFIQNELGLTGGGVLQIVAPAGQGSTSGGSSSNNTSTGGGSGASGTSAAPFGNPAGDNPNGYTECGPDSFFEKVCEN